MKLRARQQSRPQPSLLQRHHQLLWRILRQYPVITEPLQIGPLSIEFTRIADPNQVLEEIALEEDRREKTTGHRKNNDDLHLPYWAELWVSSLGLATYFVNQWVHCGADTSAISRLARQSLHSTKPVHVLDLGCGMGLVGTVAARLGLHVLFADIEAPSLLFARLNSLPDHQRCRTRRLNWQTDRLRQRFDLILGADIVYDRGQWQFLAPFFQAHLGPNGAILLGEPGRSSGAEFEPWIRARGWNLTRHEQRIPTAKSPICLMELTPTVTGQ